MRETKKDIMNNDIDQEVDDLMDDFDFKPITKGLGFHHSVSDKEEIGQELAVQALDLQKDLEKRSAQILKQNQKTDRSEVTHMGDLTPFYTDTHSGTSEIPSLNDDMDEEDIVRYHYASAFARVQAWLIDTFIIFFMYVVTILSVFVFAELPFDSIANFMVAEDIIFSSVFMFTLLYLFYFSVLDKTHYSTLGKRIVGLRLVSEDRPMTIGASMLRAIFSLTPFADKISQTRVVES